MPNGITELQKEYQDYVIAHRVRKLLGGKLEPPIFLKLSLYAKRRLERQRLARELVTVKPFRLENLARVDDLPTNFALAYGEIRVKSISLGLIPN